mmetsp:Transcript_30487/g.30143  ORF Transcript_30487/g.30143 Transcript_30487/m.30143 type:complete len:174 (-) Transcript_30487:620-1141(-)
MGCCTSKSSQSVHNPVPVSQAPVSQASSHGPHRPNPPSQPERHHMVINGPSNSLVCPRCRMEFPRNTEIRLFAEHLISCLRHSRGESQQYKILNIQISKDQPYETKAKWLQNEFNKIRIPWQSESVKFVVNREDFIQSSMAQVLFSPAEDLHKEFQISFEGENGMDAGGIFRE